MIANYRFYTLEGKLDRAKESVKPNRMILSIEENVVLGESEVTVRYEAGRYLRGCDVTPERRPEPLNRAGPTADRWSENQGPPHGTESG